MPSCSLALLAAVGVAAGAAVGLAGTLIAHAPHDVAWVLTVSPDYRNDGTVMGSFSLSTDDYFGRTTDAGLSWSTYAAGMASHDITAIAYSPDFADDGIVFVGTVTGGMFRSVDGGSTWATVNVGLAGVRVRDVAVSPAFSLDGTVVLGTDGGAYVSSDGGSTWAASNSGLLDPDLQRVAWVGGTDIVYAGGDFLSRSEDAGQTWQLQSAFPFPIASLAVSPADVTGDTLAVSYGEAGGGVFVSMDGGTRFLPSSDGLIDPVVNSVSFSGDGVMFAASGTAGCYRAEQPFGRWSVSAVGLEELSGLVENHYYAVAPSPAFSFDGTVFLAGWEGVFKSTDRGDTWSQLETYPQSINRHLVFSPGYAEDGNVFVANYGGGVMAYGPQPLLGGSASGDTLGAPNPLVPGAGAPLGPGQGTPGPSTAPLDASSLSPHWRANSTGVNGPFPDALVISPGFVDDGTLFFGFTFLYRSTDRGLTWTQLPSPGPSPGQQIITRAMGISPDFANDTTLWVGTGGDGTFRSTDAGESWTALFVGLPADLISSEIAVSPAFAKDASVLIGNRDRNGPGVYLSTDGGDSWAGAGLAGKGTTALALSPDYATDQTLLAGAATGGIYRSTDGARSWQPVSAGLPVGEFVLVDDVEISPDFAIDGTVFASLLTHGVYKSTDGGLSWSPSGAGLPLAAARRITVSPDFGTDRTVVHTNHDWVWRSTDGGETWQRLPGFLRVDDLRQAVRHSEGWVLDVVQSGAPPLSFGLGTHLAVDPAETTELTFFGDSIGWYAVEGPSAGIVRVFVDDVEQAQVDLYAKSTAYQRLAFEMSFDEPGWHTIEVRTAAANNPASSGHAVRSDGFAYTF